MDWREGNNEKKKKKKKPVFNLNKWRLENLLWIPEVGKDEQLCVSSRYTIYTAQFKFKFTNNLLAKKGEKYKTEHTDKSFIFVCSV